MQYQKELLINIMLLLVREGLVDSTKGQFSFLLLIYAYGINNSGQIVGTYEDTKGNHGYYFDGTTFNTIDYPGAALTIAYGINDKGQIVGTMGAGFVATIVPEPISSILFMAGATLLAGRKYLKKKA